MKKLLLAFIALAFIGLVFTPVTLAATIYSNDFTNNLTGFTGPGTLALQPDCSTSANGLSCATAEPAIVYSKGYSTLKCVQVDITHNGSGIDQVRLGSNGAEFGIDLFNNIGITFGASDNLNNLALTSANPSVSYDTGVAIPTSGTHTYGICNDSSTETFTIYLDNAQIFSKQILGTTALYEYGWGQVAPGDFMKNFLMSGDVNLLTTYTNDLTGSLTGFTGPGTLALQPDCSTSANGLSCATAEPAIVYDSAFYNLKCVQVDITHNGSGVNQVRIGDYKNGFHNIGITFGSPGNPNDIALTSASPNVSYDTGVAIPTSGTHIYKLCNDSTTDTFSIYLDNAQILNQQVPGILAAYQYAWLQLAPGDYMKNFLISGSLPSSSTLPVPSLKQNAGGWENTTYDLATIWSPANSTIGTWGCALTSAAMILNYYNIHTLPNSNLPLTPYTLDAWLGTQPDGYIPNGLVNWLAIARLTRQAKANNPGFTHDALEYTRSNFADTSTLISDLSNGQPDILEEPGHFIVATGQSGSTYTINDPFYPRTLLSNSPYNNSFLSLGRYVPSNTNLSYMLFTADPSLTLTLKDNSNTPVGTNFLQQPLQGAGTALTSGNSVNELYLQQPTDGDYTLTVSSNINQTYSIKGFLYDINGNVMPVALTGIINPTNQNTVTIHFDSQNLINDNSSKIVTIPSFLNDLNGLYKLSLLKVGAYESLKNIAENSQKQAQKDHILVAKVELEVLNALLELGKGRLITDTAYQILSADVQYLQSH